MTCAYAEHVRWDMLTWLPSQFLLLLLGAPSSSFCMILQKSLQNAPKIDVMSSMASQLFSFLALAMIWTEMTDDDMCIRRACYMVAQSCYFAFVGCSVFELLHDLAEVSPKCTEDWCYIQYGIANVQFLSIGDDMNLDDRWWHVHT